jgi:hypothetical protein
VVIATAGRWLCGDSIVARNDPVSMQQQQQQQQQQAFSEVCTLPSTRSCI